MTYLESILKVLIMDSSSVPDCPRSSPAGWWPTPTAQASPTDGTVHSSNPAMKYLGIALFVFVGWVILTAVLWITRATIVHHFGFDPFPMMPKK